MTAQISPALLAAIQSHTTELQTIIDTFRDWDKAGKRFDTFFRHMSDPDDSLWSTSTLHQLNEVYFTQRDSDKGMSNITLRTVAAMPGPLKNDTKKIFLQIAEICCLFNASHKVNFEADELPESFDEVKMVPGKTKGQFTYAATLPALYKKTSLTFDYWVPKILEWTLEIRAGQLTEWRNEAILQHESCTDFMRCCLLFVADPSNYPAVAKSEEREALLKLLGEEFSWIKKSAKREEILTNTSRLKAGLSHLSLQAGITIPMESWCIILQEPYIKSLVK